MRQGEVLTVNKGRMTFRFDVGERHLEQSEDPIVVQKSMESNVESESSDESRNINYPRLAVVPEPLAGWGDPFSKNEAWEELMANRYQRVDPIEDVFDDFSDKELPNERIIGPEVEVDHDYAEYRPRRPASMWKIFGTVTAAVVTGALFGFVVLSFFDVGNIFSEDSQKSTAIESIPVNSNIPVETEGQIPAVAVTLEPQTYYMLQYGVFSNAERVEIAKEELQKIGLAAGDDPDLGFRVYAGISTDREQAKLLSNQLKTQGVELYVREITLPSASELAFSGDAENLNRYFDVSADLISSLSTHSASLLGMETPIPLSNSEMVVLTELHRVWTESIKTLQAGLSPEAVVVGKKMEQTMNSALSSVTEYNRNTSKGHLWEIQSYMMEYMMGQKEIINMMKKN
ncbi:SPOR domain-containing protein [Paenibacillus macquariensis]|uniref:Stage II sporulation protein B n=2 Tax=Paenibacillus macquariensis TaxID=948756 RepID=A0ABY1JTD0_9BACL|nr:SPOR domain-containing protein [Paenibacillus macquariensis]OAB36454.1 hypothetical protein PMSM_08455 [Paenibacillus macquariensis subsp. macquariensis]SIQ72946.1 stage II sporulation protein B [Paenibacillus macquariensis]